MIDDGNHCQDTDDITNIVDKYSELFVTEMIKYSVPNERRSSYLKFVYNSLRESVELYRVICDVTHTLSAILVLRYVNLSYTLGYVLPTATDANRDEIIRRSIHKRWLFIRIDMVYYFVSYRTQPEDICDINLCYETQK